MSEKLVAMSSRINPLVLAILRSPVHFLLSPGLLLITVTGRRSGRRYTIPVGYQRLGDTVIILVADARKKQWWRNYWEPGPVVVRIWGKDHKGTAQTLSADDPEFAERAEQCFSRARFIGRIFGVNFDPRRGLSEAQRQQVAEYGAIVRITLAG